MIARLALAMCSAAAMSSTAAAQPAALIVSPDGPLRSLAVAVREAPAGAQIIVRAGTYREPPILVDRPLTIVGEGRPVIEATAPDTLLRVVADDVTVRGLVLANITPSHVDDRAALRFEHVNRCAAEQLEVRDAPFGIYLSDVRDCRIVGNVVRGGGPARRPLGNAIHLWSVRGATVADNRVSSHRDGLYFEFVQDAVIERNTSEHNGRYGLHFMFSHGCAYRENRFLENGAGVAVMYTHDVEMTRNEMRANRGATAYGLLLKDISDSRIEANRFVDNTVGMLVEGGGRLVVVANRFTRNGWAVKLMANSPQNRFEGNAFSGNSFDMATNSRNTEAAVSGNWWDRYTGYDLDRDGRGDVAFRPVRLFSLMIANHPASIVLLRSAFVDLLDAAERTLPVLTPDTLVDRAPLMVSPQ